MRKYLFILILVMVVIRELGYFNLDYYHSNMQKSVQTNWSTNSSRIHGSGRVPNNSFGTGQIFEIPVRVEYGEEILYEDPYSRVTAVVTIGSLNTGFLWFPLYKNSSFFADASVGLEGAYGGLYWDGKWVDHLSLNGSLSLSGNIAISGICSRHTAVGLVRHEVLKALVAQAKQYFAAHRFGLYLQQQSYHQRTCFPPGTGHRYH
jgi:hypothetical protein